MVIANRREGDIFVKIIIGLLTVAIIGAAGMLLTHDRQIGCLSTDIQWIKSGVNDIKADVRVIKQSRTHFETNRGG